jgi:peptide/nickel transport system substrate-binding protein
LPAFAVTRDEVERLPFYRRDLASSRRLLADAGRPKGFEFTALVAGDAPELMATAQTVQSQLKEAGIAMTIRTADTPGLAARWRTGDFQALMTAGDWSADPAAHIGPLLSATPRDGRGHCRNPEGDRLFESARAATDPAARAQLLRRLQAVLAEDVPAVWLAARPARFEIMRAAVSGYRPGPDLSRVNLDHAAVEK